MNEMNCSKDETKAWHSVGMRYRGSAVWRWGAMSQKQGGNLLYIPTMPGNSPNFETAIEIRWEHRI